MPSGYWYACFADFGWDWNSTAWNWDGDHEATLFVEGKYQKDPVPKNWYEWVASAYRRGFSEFVHDDNQYRLPELIQRYPRLLEYGIDDVV